MKNRPELEEIMLNFPAGIPVAGLRKYERGEPEYVQRIRGRVDGAIMTAGLTPDQFRKMARVMVRTGQGELVDGLFKLKGAP